MNSIYDLEYQEGTTWTHTPLTGMEAMDALLWRMSAELSSMLEVSYHPEQMREIADEAVLAIEQANTYFKARGVPRPHPLAHVIVLVERADAGLDPRGR